MHLLLAALCFVLLGCASPGPDPDPLSPLEREGCGRGGAHCGARAPSGCWCDEACLGEGDCCDDAQLRCPQPARLRVAPRMVGDVAHPVFVDVSPNEETPDALEVVAWPEEMVTVTAERSVVGRTYLDGGWQRSLEPLVWISAQGSGDVTLRLQTRGHPMRVLAEVQVTVDAEDTGRPSLTPCEGQGDVVVTRGAGRALPVALTGRVEAFMQAGGWLELRHPASDWRLGLGPAAKVLPRGVAHRTVATRGAARNAPKLVVPRGCPYGEVLLETLALSDEVDRVALAWRTQCDDGARSDGCARFTR